MIIFLGLFVMSIGAMAFAQVAEPQNLDQAVAYMPVLMKYIHSGSVLGISAVVVLLLSYVLKAYVIPRVGLNKGAIPVISMALGVLVGPAIAIISGASPEQAVQSLAAGPWAVFMHEAIAKYFQKV